jgi:hypothetical protein
LYKLSAALWVHISAFESTLRSSLNSALILTIGQTDWWNSQDFFSKFEKRELKKYLYRFSKNKGILGNREFAEIPSLTFWINLLSRRNGFRIWRHLENLSPTLKAYGRRNFQQKAIIIRDLRNAIAHHAPILHRNLARDLAYMHELTDLLSPGLAKVLKTQSKAGSLVKLLKTNTPGAKF